MGCVIPTVKEKEEEKEGCSVEKGEGREKEAALNSLRR